MENQQQEFLNNSTLNIVENSDSNIEDIMLEELQENFDIYALSSDVYSKQDINDLFKQYTKNTAQLSNIYRKSQLSNKNELTEEFAKYYVKTETSSKIELDNKFKDYALLSNTFTYLDACNKLKKYALSSDVYSKNEISNKSELAKEFSKYQKSGNYALSSDVYSKDFIKKELNSIRNELDDNSLKLNGKYQDVSGTVTFKDKVRANKLLPDNITTSFEKITNSTPKEFLSTLTDNSTNEDFLINFFQTLNEIIIDSKVDVNLVNVSLSKSSTIEDFVNQLNELNNITGSEKMTNSNSLSVFVEQLNNNIAKLSSTTSDFNIRQSLSSLADKINVINTKNKYNRDLIIDIIKTFENGYTRSQTSSAYQLKTAFDNMQKKGNYALSNDVNENFISKDYAIENFVQIKSPSVVESNTTYNKNLTVNGTVDANKITIDYNNLIAKNSNGYLSTYLYYLYQPSMYEIINRINEIKLFCDLKFDTIEDPLSENIFIHICNATNFICNFSNIPILPLNPTYEDIKDSLNNAINKIKLHNGLSLHKILKTQQYINMVQSLHLFTVYNDTITNLSNEMQELKKENLNLAYANNELFNLIFEISAKI